MVSQSYQAANQGASSAFQAIQPGDIQLQDVPFDCRSRVRLYDLVSEANLPTLSGSTMLQPSQESSSRVDSAQSPKVKLAW